MVKAISNAIKKATGLWHYQTSQDEVRCLCISRLHEHMDTSSYIIGRFDPIQREREPCDRCGRLGYDYTLRAKRKIARK